LFVFAFMALVVLNSLMTLPAPVIEAGNAVSRWCLVTSIAAIGMKTRLGDIVALGLRPVALMVLETTMLAAIVIVLLNSGLV